MNDPRLNFHDDADLFRDALRFTATETGFSERLIEKDYYCSVVLADFTDVGIVFKGGTCLSKIHADFCRLSEDLDFSVSTPVDSKRSQRSRQVNPFKSHFTGIEERLRFMHIVEPLRGYNNSTQYGARLGYRSEVSGQVDFIKVEVSVREPIVETPIQANARTLVMDPFRRTPAVPTVEIPVLTLTEAYAEKLRAALSRRTPAIRDFFDIDHALSNGSIVAENDALVSLLNRKLSIPGNDPVDVSTGKLDLLRQQLEPQLKPVLRDQDFASFDLNRAFIRVSEIANTL